MDAKSYLALFLAIAAVCMDLVSEKIDNRLILCGWLLGLGYQLGTSQLQGLMEFLAGAVLPVFLLAVLFWFRMLGPGDIKLLSVLGGLLGSQAVLFCIFYSFLFGAILSAAFLVACGNLVQRLNYFSHYIYNYIQTKKRVPYYLPGSRLENIHFTVPVLMGVMLYAGGFY
ncbi:MAG: prepilin peptidase [Blautia sp.]|jgi:prepilin peptidase CpaA